MSDEVLCEEAQRLMFERRRGELSELKRAAVDEHLDNCRVCRRVAQRTDEMLDAAAEADADDWAQIDSDEGFERIRGRIGGETQKPANEDIGENEETRLDEAFQVAGGVDEEDWADIDADEVFEGISRRIGRADAGGDTAADDGNVGGGDEELGGDEQRVAPDEMQSGRRGGFSGRRGWLAVAAAACAALIGWWMIAVGGPWGPDGGGDVEPAGQTAGGDEPGEQSGEDTGVPGVVALPSLQRVSSPIESLQMFADESADYEITESGEGDRVALNNGSLLMEVSPDSASQLSVTAQSHTVEVTGTVFSVETGDDAPTVAVYEGEVRVTSPEGTTRRVETGEYLAGAQRGELDDASRADIEQYVDLQAHRQMIREARREAARESVAQVEAAVAVADSRIEEIADSSERDERHAVAHQSGDHDHEQTSTDEDPGDGEEPEAHGVQPRNEGAGAPLEEPEEPASTTPRQLHEDALEALRGGEPHRAADLLEEALEQTDPTDPARADILLELARIHLHELDDPDRSGDYLNRFVEQWPDDPAADTIRDRLCEMEVEDVGEAVCD